MSTAICDDEKEFICWQPVPYTSSASLTVWEEEEVKCDLSEENQVSVYSKLSVDYKVYAHAWP